MVEIRNKCWKSTLQNANIKLNKLIIPAANSNFRIINFKNKAMSTRENQPLDVNNHFEKEKREFQEAKDKKEMREGKEHLGIDDVAGTDENDLGTKKYKSFSNHDSSQDVPKTSSGPGTV